MTKREKKEQPKNPEEVINHDPPEEGVGVEAVDPSVSNK